MRDTAAALPADGDQVSLSAGLWDMLAAIRPGDIPASARERVRLCVLDTIGVALAAAARGVGTAGAKVARPEHAGATVWGSGFTARAQDAALANGILAHALDFDDTHPEAIMHTSAIIVPAALAVAEEERLSGDALVAALVAGYEAAARLGRAAPGAFQENGFQATAVLGVFAATVAVGHLRGVSHETARNAMGLAGSMASGLMEYLSDGSDAKQMHCGWAAQSAIRAVDLARAGLTGPARVLEGRFGVYRSFTRREAKVEEILAPFRPRFEVERMAPKPYPACLCVHAGIDAMLALRRSGAFQPDNPDNIAEIICEVPQWYVNLVLEPLDKKMHPRTPYEARFSLPYCLARAAVDGRVGLDSFGKDRLTDSGIAALAQRVSYKVRQFDEFPEAFPAVVTLRTADGHERSHAELYNRGSERNPMSRAEIEAKFADAVGDSLSQDQARAVITAIQTLSGMPTLNDLSAVLRQAVPAV
ncbi:MmgE/PrpD family protein [Ferruginivarius sediminum]|uniref:MmgE/PrpD family protein n=1 Tax=Ferruginivarius sediminum TaxID=2661937 RepID=A0A369T9L7_9PROT|nr:MmgE/PrpD family protein [Ferruginivarius sediminum]RDD61978.1 MmgE/PrpD family protein [Ferruginivarius sediminum]